ncbi:MAG: zinc finger domain-containing protein [Acidimicrobiales bacterium]
MPRVAAGPGSEGPNRWRRNRRGAGPVPGLARPERPGGRGPTRPAGVLRGGRPCRRCGATVVHGRHGGHARSTYWCPRCQPS